MSALSCDSSLMFASTTSTCGNMMLAFARSRRRVRMVPTRCDRAIGYPRTDIEPFSQTNTFLIMINPIVRKHKSSIKQTRAPGFLEAPSRSPPVTVLRADDAKPRLQMLRLTLEQPVYPTLIFNRAFR